MTGAPSSYSQDKTFSPTFTPVAAYSPTLARYGQEEYEEGLKSLEEDEAHRQQYISEAAEQSLDYQEADQDQDYNEYQDAKEYQEEEEAAEPYVHEVHHASETHFHEASEIVEQEPESEHQPSHGVEVQVSKEPVQESEEIKADETVVPEKTKTRRTWYGKKKKDKGEKEKDKGKEEKEKEKEKARDAAKLMDEALFGGPVKASKNLPEQSSSDTKPAEPMADDDELRGYNDDADADANADVDADVDALSHHPHHPQDESTISSTRAPVTESLHDSEIQDLESASASHIILPESEQGTETPDSIQKIEIDASAPKRSKSRHFSIFRSKKKSVEPLVGPLVEPLVEEQPQQPQQKDGGALTLTITNDDDKSIHSHTTRKSSVHGADRRAAAEMAAALAVKPKDNVKRKSDEYVPYEYQEELEGPLMERVPVPENREVIGFVLVSVSFLSYTVMQHDFDVGVLVSHLPLLLTFAFIARGGNCRL